MAIHKITATYLCPGDRNPQKGQVLILDEAGKILAIEPLSNHDPASVMHREGLLTPGFINAHCHLELSHLKDRVPTGTGLLPFLKGVVSLREVEPEVIQEAIAREDRAMYVAGIQAVGDICNTADTVAVKSNSPIDYYSFVELFDFMQDHQALATYERSKQVLTDQRSTRHAVSAVPHAPYTVSDKLYGYIHQENDKNSTISLHNQETPHEDALFQDGSGGFPSFFREFGIDFKFDAPGTSSLDYARKRLHPDQPILLVHNTMSTLEDIREAMEWNPSTFWVTCPNANLYIENRMPDYRKFQEAGAIVAIGTDSLTSNWQLSIFEEIKTILRYQSYLPFDEVLRWATYHGALALQMEEQLGSFGVGKKPGVLWINTHASQPFDIRDAQVHRLF
ncbi:MAG TPA: amidohydrolase family protein [Saprospiraceae bacterium]|nr:amidohydrolase family protein [Saprospiraceae bacterium]MCB9267972.1 amidohydrolase family protein [Lewinellaceae bacterium]HPG07573.1 amidohydrolase family protein [Saprospiraceae bacterium]HQU54417.1 amidohydrolase family protein [Saprospiraceae bacterium]HRV86063.1 amidohydrolase family protein [Saprospiraceae bacterium]